MTVLDVVKLLRQQGHSITYYKRKDGGILITSIDETKFASAHGNAKARELANVKISEARFKQLQYATRSKIYLREMKRKGIERDSTLYGAFLKAKRKWNKAFKSKGGKPHPAGYFTWRHIQYTLEHEGYNEALRLIGEAERYATGLAYNKNVQILASQIEEAGVKYESEELLQLAEDLRANAYRIRDEWIYMAYEELYKLNQGAEPVQVADNVRKILRLL